MKKIITIIPASGSGSRFCSKKPKQLNFINHEIILEKTHKIFDIECIHKILIAVNQSILNDLIPLKNKFSAKSEFVLSGGETRAQTVLNTLNMMSDDVDSDDWIIVHDAVRPYLLQTTLIKFINEAVNTKYGAIMAYPVVETVKEVGEDLQVKSTLDRNKIWLAQTPQMYPYGLLKKSLENYPNTPTDESQAMEFFGYNPQVIMGDLENIKITFPKDLKVND
ncbi:MAG: IspD/TarI family cytidylyltransferase [Proteobacteria bacterium]|nr:IspD/TarI family cytidylyltransferase [Pseudomonadota bacterium]